MLQKIYIYIYKTTRSNPSGGVPTAGGTPAQKQPFPRGGSSVPSASPKATAVGWKRIGPRGRRGDAAPSPGTASRARASRMLSNSTDTRGHAYVIRSGSLVQARAGRPARPRGGQCIANITREDKHRVPLSDNCTWAVSTDLAAVSAPKRLQKQGHCEHQGGVRSTMVSLKITRVSNPKEVEKEKRKGRKKKGGKKQKALPSSKGPPRAQVSSHR